MCVMCIKIISTDTPRASFREGFRLSVRALRNIANASLVRLTHQQSCIGQMQFAAVVLVHLTENRISLYAAPLDCERIKRNADAKSFQIGFSEGGSTRFRARPVHGKSRVVMLRDGWRKGNAHQTRLCGRSSRDLLATVGASNLRADLSFSRYRSINTIKFRSIAGEAAVSEFLRTEHASRGKLSEGV